MESLTKNDITSYLNSRTAIMPLEIDHIRSGSLSKRSDR